MKHLIFALSGAAMTILAIAIILSLHSRDIRRVELERNLDAAASQTLRNACVTHKKEIGDNDALVADFISNFLGRMKSDGKNIEVDIYEADIYKGIISAHVREKYSHPNGRSGEIEAKTTSIVEREARRPTIVENYYIPWDIARDAGFDFSETEGRMLYYTRRHASGTNAGRSIKGPDVRSRRFTGWKVISRGRNGSTDYLAVYE